MRLNRLSVMDSGLDLELNLADLLEAPCLHSFVLLCYRVRLTGLEDITLSMFQDRSLSVTLFTTDLFTLEDTSLLEKLSFTVSRCERGDWPPRVYITDEEEWLAPKHPVWMARLLQ